MFEAIRDWCTRFWTRLYIRILGDDFFIYTEEGYIVQIDIEHLVTDSDVHFIDPATGRIITLEELEI